MLLFGNDLRREYQGGHHEIGGFFDGLAEARIDPVPLMAARAVPSGTITDQTLAYLVERMLEQVHAAGQLDGVLVAPHGAATAETERDADGYWLNQLRQTLGPNVPIIGTLDLHATLSRRMLQATDALIAYRTNPHLDQRQRGIEAARLIARTLRREVRPTQAATFPPVAINIERQLTADSPCKELIAQADEQLARPGVLANSVVLGFPYADKAEMGSSFIAVTDNDPALAQKCARELADYLTTNRADFIPRLIAPEQAVEQAIASPKPVCLLDIGDNVGGGAPGDGTVLAHILHRRRIRSVVCLWDPAAVEAAKATGIGGEMTTSLGGKAEPLGMAGPPLSATFRVLGLYTGDFEETAVRHGGKRRYHMGPSAVLQTDTGLTILLTSRRTPPFSLNQLTSCGIDPAKFDVLVAKGVHAPVAAYRLVCPTLIRVNTPGVTTADIQSLPYSFRRRPLFPFEEI